MFNPVIICLFKSRKELTYFGSSPQWSLQMLQLLQSALNTCRWRAVPVRCSAAVPRARRCSPVQFTIYNVHCCCSRSTLSLCVASPGRHETQNPCSASVQTWRQCLTLFGMEMEKTNTLKRWLLWLSLSLRIKHASSFYHWCLCLLKHMVAKLHWIESSSNIAYITASVCVYWNCVKTLNIWFYGAGKF